MYCYTVVLNQRTDCSLLTSLIIIHEGRGDRTLLFPVISSNFEERRLVFVNIHDHVWLLRFCLIPFIKREFKVCGVMYLDI